MQRRAYASGLAALLAALSTAALAGCSSDSGSDDSGIDAKVGTAAGSIAQPGRHRTLFEPCGSVSLATLRSMLPAVTALPAEQRDRVLRGTAAITYDTDRRVGCAWKADGPDAIHHLTLDFERVVSYDPSVSDETRAQEVYTSKESAAGLAPAPRPAVVPDTAPDTGTAGSALAPAGQQAQTVPPTVPGTPSAPPAGPESRTLTDLGDAAFLDDALVPAGPAAPQRTVSVVFRTSNVIVTVRYTAQPTRVGEVPDSEELQERASRLAHRLAERFDE
ncbi:DUF3558 domain-containing protein [Streptomyces sp. Act-28]